MQSLRITCVAIAILCLAANPGCSILVSKQPQSNAVPVSIGDRAKSSAKYVAVKSKNATVTTLKYVVVGSLKFTGWVFTSWLKNLGDDNDKPSSVFDPDPLWQQGYGFNNPNNERIRQGLPPVNFDGSAAE